MGTITAGFQVGRQGGREGGREGGRKGGKEDEIVSCTGSCILSYFYSPSSFPSSLPPFAYTPTGGNTAINWTQPSNLARTTDVLVYLAQNLTKLNASKEMEGKPSLPPSLPLSLPPSLAPCRLLLMAPPPSLPPSFSPTGSIAGLCLLNEPWTTAVGGPVQLDTLKSW